MSRLVSMGLAVFLAGGCGTSGTAPAPLNRAALRVTHPRGNIAINAPSPHFLGTTSAGALSPTQGGLLAGLLAGVVSGIAAAEEDDRMRKKEVYDPAIAIRAVIVKALAKRFSLQVVAATKLEAGLSRAWPASSIEQPRKLQPDPADARWADSVAELAYHNRTVDLVLDIRTSRWGFAPASLGRYGITYMGTLRLIDTRSQTLIAEGSCISLPLDAPDAPTFKQLMAHDAARLKEMLQSLEAFCTEDYRTRILGLYGQ